MAAILVAVIAERSVAQKWDVSSSRDDKLSPVWLVVEKFEHRFGSSHGINPRTRVVVEVVLTEKWNS